jgi:hypothetical protein
MKYLVQCTTNERACTLADCGRIFTFACREEVSPNGELLSRRGRGFPANASGFDPHRASVSGRFDCRSCRASPTSSR